MKHDNNQSIRCHFKLDGAARSDGPNLHSNKWPITTEALSRPWILLKHDHYQSPRCHVKLNRAVRSDGPNLHANSWPPASTVQSSFLFLLFSSKPSSGWYKELNCSTSTLPYAGWTQDRILLFLFRLPPIFLSSGRLGKKLLQSGRPILHANTWPTPLPFTHYPCFDLLFRNFFRVAQWS
jgi:hypothetical protein